MFPEVFIGIGGKLMNQNKIVKILAIIGMLVIAIIFSVMPTVQILGVDLLPSRPVVIPPQVIEVETRTGVLQFDIPPLDLRENQVDHFQIEQWFLEELNYRRDNALLPHFLLDARATVTSIEHSIDMRDSRFIGVYASDGRTQEERLEYWFADEVEPREKSSVVLGYNIKDGLDQYIVRLIVDHLFIDEENTSILLSPNYRYIGAATSVDEYGNGAVSITLIGENY